MKNIIKFLAFVLLVINFNSCEGDDPADNPNIDTQSVKKFSTSISDFNMALTDYVEITQKCQGANLSKMSTDEVSSLIDEYINVTEAYIEAYRYSMEFNKNVAKSTHNKMGGDCFTTVGGGMSLSPVTPYLMGEKIGDTKEKIAKNNKDKENKIIDENEHFDNQYSILHDALAACFNFASVGIMTAGAILLTGHAFTSMNRPPGFIVRGTIQLSAGAVAGGTVIWYAASVKEDGNNKNKSSDPEYIIMTGRTTVGGSIPIHLFPDKSDLVIAIEGYAPVTINDFKLPKSGMNKIIEIEGVKLKDATWGGKCNVCFFEENITVSSCAEVEFVNATAYPVNPAPGVGVTVTASLIPIAANCGINFSITGTDGYTNSSTMDTNSEGEATFYIPGGKESVVDVVTITSSNGKKYTVTYVF